MTSMRQNLLKQVDRRTLERAEDYVYSGKVLELSQGRAGIFYGRVSGSTRKASYNCTVITGPGPDGPFSQLKQCACSCPVTIMCKHAIACFILIQDADVLEEAQDVSPHSVQTLPSRDVMPALTPAAWLKRTAQALTSATQPGLAESTFAYGSKQRILYVLSIMEHPKHGTVAHLLLYRATVAVSGAYSRIAALRELVPKVMTDLDEAAFELLGPTAQIAAMPIDRYGRRDGGAAEQISMIVHGGGSARALQAVAATSRLRFESPQGPVLSPAAPRWAKMAWQRDPALSQKLGLVLEPDAKFQVFEDAPYYIDVAAGALGRIVTDVHPELLLQLAHAPPVRPEDAEAFAAGIPPALAAQIPAPEVLPVRDVEAVPTVSLALRQQQDESSVAHMHGELRYNYAGAQVAAHADSDAVYVRDEQGISRIKRQPKHEQLARRKLIRATGIKQPKAKDVIDLGPCVDKQAFFAMSEKLLAPFKAEGWHIDAEAGHNASIVHADDNPDATMQPSKRGGWFELDMGIVVGSRRISLPPLLVRLLHDPAWGLNTAALAESGRQTVFVPINDEEVVSMPTDRIIDLLGMLESLGDLAEVHDDGVLRLPLSDAHLLRDLKRRDKLQLMAPDGLARLAETLRDSASPPPVAPPANLEATLRAYQCVE
jgi:hypothetical protein